MTKPFIAAMIIPTGIGCEIGGHAGDATPAARLLAGVCDTLILHPNVVNAADINEMPANSLYVEGSMLDRFLRGEIYLEPVRANRLLVVCNKIIPATVNCAETARVNLGVEVEVFELSVPLTMRSEIKAGIASGTVEGISNLCSEIRGLDFDAVAIHTEVEVEKETALAYMRELGTNPWGGVEAIVSRQVSEALGVPCAHAPVETNSDFNEIVPPALAAEMISGSMLFCVLKGLHKAPRIGLEQSRHSLSVDDLDALVSPDCWGAPHVACQEAGVPVYIVEENTCHSNPAPDNGHIRVRSYAEAAGALVALREGISLGSTRRPLTACVPVVVKGYAP